MDMDGLLEIPAWFGTIVDVWVGETRGIQVLLVQEVSIENIWWLLYEVGEELEFLYAF